MKLKWYGHSSFLVISKDGTKFIFDPYEPNCYNGGITYGPITDTADIVLISHEHPDHNYFKGISGKPIVVKGTGSHSPKGIHIKGISTYHDKSRGKERGPNTIFNLEIDGLHFCHLGDLGHELTPSDSSLIGPVDILLIPIGGFFTIDAGEADKVIDRLQPKLVIPMHYKTEKCGFPIATLDIFLGGKDNYKYFKEKEIEISQQNLPKSIEIWAIPHSN